MYQDDDYGTGGMEVITDVMKGYNMELVACEAFDAASTDMSAQLVNVKAADPDCLIMWCMYTPGATIATQARQLGIEAQFMGGGGLTNAKLYELGGENVVGLINTQPVSYTHLALSRRAASSSDAGRSSTALAACSAAFGTRDTGASMDTGHRSRKQTTAHKRTVSRFGARRNRSRASKTASITVRCV